MTIIRSAPQTDNVAIMRNALMQLRKQRAMLDRAIRALEELEKIQAAGELPKQTSAAETTPGGFIIIRGGAHSKPLCPPDTILERIARTRLR